MNLKVLPMLSKESETGYNSLLPKVTSVTHHQYHICHLITICTWHSAGWTCCCKFILLSSTAYKLSWDILSAVQDSRKLFLVRWRTLLFLLLLLYVLIFFRTSLRMQKCLGELTTDFVWFIFLAFIVIMKLLQIFVPRGRPLYQDEFSYYKNMFSSDNKEIQILKVCIVGLLGRIFSSKFTTFRAGDYLLIQQLLQEECSSNTKCPRRI